MLKDVINLEKSQYPIFPKRVRSSILQELLKRLGDVNQIDEIVDSLMLFISEVKLHTL